MQKGMYTKMQEEARKKEKPILNYRNNYPTQNG
jgi:hypothetical protein